MLEDGSWEKPPRPLKLREFIPVEEVHEEHLHPAYDAGPLTPEEVLIQEEEVKAEQAKEDFDTGDSYEWEERESREENERRLKAAIAKFVEQEQSLPREPLLRKEEIKSQGGRRPVQGRRGKEPLYKNKKGQPTVRKPNGRLEA